MKKFLIGAALALVANAAYVSKVNADAWLVILAGYDANGLYHPSYIHYFGGDYSQEHCIRVLEDLSRDWNKPAFSYCTIKEPVWRHIR